MLGFKISSLIYSSSCIYNQQNGHHLHAELSYNIAFRPQRYCTVQGILHVVDRCPLQWGSSGGIVAPLKALGSSFAERCIQNWRQPSSTMIKTTGTLPSHTSGLSINLCNTGLLGVDYVCQFFPHCRINVVLQGNVKLSKCTLRWVTKFHSKTAKYQAIYTWVTDNKGPCSKFTRTCQTVQFMICYRKQFVSHNRTSTL